MTLFHGMLLFYWILFACLHSVMASVWWKGGVAKITGRYFRYYRLTYSCFNFAFLGFIVWYQFSHNSVQLFAATVSRYAGYPLAVLGLYIMGVCIKKYFANLSGVDVFTRKTAPMVLEIGGLHRYMRHPLYSGTLLFMWSLFLIFPTLANLIACGVNTLYVLIGIRIEEKKLVMEYGDRYVLYAKKTPKLIPFLRLG